MPKLLLISDTHGCFQYPAYKEKIEPLYDMDVNVIVCMGDVYEMELKLVKSVADGKGISIYGIPGNHEPKVAVSEAGIEDIHGKVVDICGVKVAGIGGCPKYKDDSARLFLTAEESVELANSMDKADILVTHAPSLKGFSERDPAHRGLEGIDEYIKKHSPAFHFYGHVHERGENKFIVKKGLFKKNVTKQYGIYKAALFDTDKRTIEYLF